MSDKLYDIELLDTVLNEINKKVEYRSNEIETVTEIVNLVKNYGITDNVDPFAGMFNTVDLFSTTINKSIANVNLVHNFVLLAKMDVSKENNETSKFYFQKVSYFNDLLVSPESMFFQADGGWQKTALSYNLLNSNKYNTDAIIEVFDVYYEEFSQTDPPHDIDKFINYLLNNHNDEYLKLRNLLVQNELGFDTSVLSEDELLERKAQLLTYLISMGFTLKELETLTPAQLVKLIGSVTMHRASASVICSRFSDVDSSTLYASSTYIRRDGLSYGTFFEVEQINPTCTMTFPTMQEPPYYSPPDSIQNFNPRDGITKEEFISNCTKNEGKTEYLIVKSDIWYGESLYAELLEYTDTSEEQDKISAPWDYNNLQEVTNFLIADTKEDLEGQLNNVNDRLYFLEYNIGLDVTKEVIFAIVEAGLNEIPGVGAILTVSDLTFSYYVEYVNLLNEKKSLEYQVKYFDELDEIRKTSSNASIIIDGVVISVNPKN